MKRYIVTGGAGFIGSALVRALLDLGDGAVEVIDDFSSGREANLAGISSRIAIQRADIRDYDAMLSLVRGADVVFHMAAIPSVPRSIAEPVPSHDVNINGTFSVLRAAADGKVRRLVYAASSSAYGDTPVLPKVESMAASPKSPYAAQKLMGEYYASLFATCFGLETVSLRFFNVYGPRQDPSSPYSGILSIFMRCLIERRPPVLFGDGEQTRDFTYVEDVAELVIKASRAGAALCSGKVYNAGNGSRYSLNETWRLLQRIEGVDIPPLYGPPRPGDVRDSQADTTAAVADLGHAPRFTFEEGLRRTLDWYKKDAGVA
jgi:UDP-glucose 4-epimerase